MPTVTDIQRVLRDHVRFTGDGQPNAPVGAPLPRGDPRSGMHNLDKYEIRELLIAILQTQGDAGALQTIITQLDAKADLAFSGRIFGTRQQAVDAGQAALPPALGRIWTREGFGAAATVKIRTPGDGTGADPLFTTAPYWSLDMEIDPDLYMRNSGRFFGSRAAAVAFGQARLPGSLDKILTIEGTAAAPIWTLRTPGDGTGPDPLFATAPFWSVVDRIDPSGERAARIAAIASLESSRRLARTVRGLTPMFYLGSVTGLVVRTDPSGNSWIEGPGIGGSGNMAEVRAYAAPRIARRSSALPTATDGRSLYKLKGEAGRLKAGIVGAKPKLILGSDSLAQLDPIPVAVRNRIAESYPMSEGWGLWPSVRGARFANSGAGYSIGLDNASNPWTIIDVTQENALPYGCGLDGNMLTTTRADAVATFTSVQLNELRIFSRNFGGSYRYTVDNQAAVIVTHPNDGGLTITTIGGLSDALHNIVIDTVGNTGRVAIGQHYLTRNAPGFEVLRAGNGGALGRHLGLMAPSIQAIAANIQPHAAISILATNDQRASEGVSAFIAGQRAWRDAYRAADPDLGFIFVSPALSGGAVVTPMSEFRDALYEFCIDEGHEFYNMTDDWGPFAATNAQGLWTDNLHPNAAGGAVFASAIFNHFLRG